MTNLTTSNQGMGLGQNIKYYWGAIRWKMLIIFAFFSVVSTILIGALSVAVLNVVIRRESAYLIEERIKTVVDNYKRFTPSLADGIDLPASNLPLVPQHSRSVWGDSQTLITVVPEEAIDRDRPSWLPKGSFTGIVVDQGSLEIRSFHEAEGARCCSTILVTTPLSGSFLEQMAREAGLQISDSKPMLLHPYRTQEGAQGEIEANFIPGSRRPVPVVVIARNWQTGALENWVVCEVRPTYARTIDDLSHMGLRPASYVAPLGTIAFALALVYACGLLLSARLSQRIVAVIDGLSHAALRVGKGDFSVRVAVPEQDQLGMLASSFNEMTQDLENLRQQEKQNAVLERDMALAREVQQHLYPQIATVLAAASVWGINAPARVVSGDLYDFLSFSDSEVGLLCADVSGKGVPAALMMAHLQALVHGRLLALDPTKDRPAPGAFVTALNRDLQGRFGNSRYATMFYGEFDSRTRLLRYINAGHCTPLLISDRGEATKLSGGDLPIGLFPEVTYQELHVTLAKGSTVVVYTDGVTEARNLQEEEFGEERLISCCALLPEGANAKEICMLLSNKVAEWSAGAEQFDDMTILILTVD
jgi:serine phosphatase RsbU (regulator of sigma subunit)